MERPKKFTDRPEAVNVHQVVGDIDAIKFLKDADFHLVEGWFFRAKQVGRCEFDFNGLLYRLVKNRNLTYTVEKVPEKILAND